jgi:HEAT repeat protein
LQDDKTQVAAAVKELFPLIAKPLPDQREQITDDLAQILSRFRPFLLKKLETIPLEGGSQFSSDEDRDWVSREYEEQGIYLGGSLYLLMSGDFLDAQKPEVIEHEGISKNHLWSYTLWKRPTPKKVGIYSVSTPEVLTGIKWLVLEYFRDLDEKDLSTLRPFSKEFIQFIVAGASSTTPDGRMQEVQDTAGSILLKIEGEAVPVLGEAIVDKLGEPIVEGNFDNDQKVFRLTRLLAEIGDKRGIAPLFQVLRDGLARGRYLAAEEVALEALEKMSGKDLSFPDENSRIEFHMVRALRLGNRGSIDSLLSYVDNDRVARWLLSYMGRSVGLLHYIGSKFVERDDHRVVEPLAGIIAGDRARRRRRQIWESENCEETKVATKLLGDLGGKEAERILIDTILNDSKEARQSARDALIKIGNPNIAIPLTEGINMKKNEYKKTLNKQAYKQMLSEFDEAYEVLRTIDKRPRTFLDNLLGRRKY